MTVYDLLEVMEYHCCGFRIQNDALIDEGREVLVEADDIDDIKYSDNFDDFSEEEVTDLYAENTGKVVICINKEQEDL